MFKLSKIKYEAVFCFGRVEEKTQTHFIVVEEATKLAIPNRPAINLSPTRSALSTTTRAFYLQLRMLQLKLKTCSGIISSDRLILFTSFAVVIQIVVDIIQ